MAKGWLDNYGKEDNYNDYQVSAPKGFRGDGYSNVGRNYSPAWGGQFQNGGKAKKKELEDYIDDFLGNPQAGARYMSDINPDEDPIDNIRHSFAGRYTQDAISKRLGNGVMANVAGLVGSNLMGAAHEISTLGKDNRPWMTKLRESGEDMVNNAVGSVVGAIPYMDDKTKDKMMYKMSFGNLLPDGYVSTEKGRKKGQSDNVYFKNQKGKIERKYQMGGSLPGATGMMYARIGAPSNGKYAKKTKASAKDGEVIKDDMGQWAHPGEITEINSPYITMKGVDYPVLGISDEGDTQMMYPDEEYEFIGNKVTEYPMAKNGVNQQDEKSLQQLDQLTNFTNYNTKQPGGWLDTL